MYRIAFAVLAVTFASACATAPEQKPPPPAPKANVSGMKIFVEPLEAVATTSEDCKRAESAMLQGLPAQLKRSAEKALTEAGFEVVTDAGQADTIAARLDGNVTYCSGNEAHIASGEVGLSLVGGTRVVARSAMVSDVATSTDPVLARVVNQLLHQPSVIEYCDSKRTK